MAKKLQLISFLCAALLLSSCAEKKVGKIHDSGLLIQDPYEDLNRKVFNFNRGADKHVIHPVIDGYKAITPKPARTGLKNFLRNLRSPVDLANQILQLDFKGAHDVLVRTAVNSTIGLGGLIDVAEYEGIKYEYEDFGQTLAVWGVDHGSYFILPFIGPSSMRDYTGYIGDSALDPLRIYLFNIEKPNRFLTKFGADYLTVRESLKDVQTDLERNSIDYYAALRSIYYQRREALIKDADAETVDLMVEIPDYDDPDFEDDY